ncbi:MAG TPA: hypothetical protein VF491_06295, partial [Vicinamibacterales bacterium]
LAGPCGTLGGKLLSMNPITFTIISVESVPIWKSLHFYLGSEGGLRSQGIIRSRFSRHADIS